MIDARETPAGMVPVITNVADRKSPAPPFESRFDWGESTARDSTAEAFHERIRLMYARPPIGHPGSLFDFRL